MDSHEPIQEPDAQEEPSVPELPSIADGEDRPVDPRSVRIVRLIAVPVVLAATVVPLIIFTLIWAMVRFPAAAYLAVTGALLLLAGLGLLIAYHLPAARHRHLRYRVDPEGLRIRQGVFWRKTIRIPITRVQHTDVSQGPLQRKYDLATLTVHTAGTASASIPLPGLEHSVAIRLSEHLHPVRKTDAG